MMIRVVDLTFTYPEASEPAVSGLEFAVERGEVFGFLGPSGAGKSTTQKILIGLLREYSGDVSVLGRSLREWDSGLYERVGVSFEIPTHYLKLTGLENLAYFAALYGGPTRPARELLDLVDLGADGHMPVSQYSKGMKGRLSVARALLHSPDLLFLDEPTAGLDPVNARRIRDLIRAQRAEGRTVFLTTHDMATADELCDRVAFIVDGRIAHVEAPRDLKLRYGRKVVRVEYRDGDSLSSREFPLAGLGDDPAFLDLLRTADVQTVHTLEATLDDVFVRVTGRSLV